MSRLLAIGVIGLLFTASQAAEAPRTVDRIVADYMAARGGLSKIRAVQTLRQKGHAFGSAGRQAIVVRELKRPGKIRFEFTVQGMTGVYVADNGAGWRVSPLDGSLEPTALSEQAAADAMEQADFDGPLVDWKAKGHRIELAGQETIDGRMADKLAITLADGSVRHDFLDATTHLLLRSEVTRRIKGHDVRVQMTFGDYKKTAGVMFPRKVEVGAIGRPQTLRVVVDSVEVNPPIKDARFTRPATP